MNLENSQRVEVTDDRHKIILGGAVPSAGTNLSLVKSTRKLPFYQAKWGLKQCLLALGFSLEEMRYRKGCRSIIENWVNEEKELLELVKKRWKELAVQYHEARGGDPEKWKNVNAIYSCALKKIVSNIRKRKLAPIFEYECIICNETVKKVITHHAQLQSKLCDKKECLLIHRRRIAKKHRDLIKPIFEKFCAYIPCNRRFTTSSKKKKYCRHLCYREHNKAKFLNELKNNPEKRKYYESLKKERYNKLTPEQKKEHNKRLYLKRITRFENKSPEEQEKILENQRNRSKKYREKLQREGKKITYKTPTYRQRIEKARERYKDKPWLFETWLQKFKERIRNEAKRHRLKKQQQKNIIAFPTNNNIEINKNGTQSSYGKLELN